MSGMPKRLVIDVDTGTDDALALLYALAHPDLELLGISCVTGNVTVDQAVINSCKVLDAACTSDIPVAAGAGAPLIERARREGASHGPDGLAGIQLPKTSRQRSSLHAVELLHHLIMGSPEPVSLVTLAPKTNLAMLLTRYPEVAARVGQMIFMGGSTSGENTTGDAEFNVWQDPEAARCVIESSIPTTMYPFELFNRLAVSQGVTDRFRRHDHPAIRLAGELLHRRRTSSHGPTHDQVGLLGDAGALVLLTNPELFVTREFPIQVNLNGINRGRTVADQHAGPRRTAVAVDLDAAQAASAFVRVIDAYAA